MGSGSYADLRGATTVSLVSPVDKALVEARLGPDPLRPRPDPDRAWARPDAHYVDRRTGLPCRVCRSAVATQPMAGRNLFWCPTCQVG